MTRNLNASALTIFASTYMAVFLAEMVGDRSFFAIGSLTLRLRRLPLYAGVTAAFMLKALAAVAAGSLIARLPDVWPRVVGTGSLGLAAIMVWRHGAEEALEEPRQPGLRAVGVAFLTVFFSEWADPGQVAAAGLSAHYGAPLLVWLAATAALVTKGALAVTVGAGLARALSPAWRRSLAVAALATLATLIGIGIEG